MAKAFIITAALVGAVPKFISTKEPRFIPQGRIGDLYLAGEDNHEAGDEEAAVQALIEGGWVSVPPGGIFLPHPIESFNLLYFDTINDAKLSRELILQLSSAGWKDLGYGVLAGLTCAPAYIPPALLGPILEKSPQFIVHLLNQGWEYAEAGYWNASRNTTPYLPVAPGDIVQASIDAVLAGAAIVHLHTRDRSGKKVRSRVNDQVISLSEQSNKILPADYDHIVSALHKITPESIINLSTSARGRADFNNPIRRAHLKGYGATARVPEIASFSPGPVLFKAGGGYENDDEFLKEQTTHFQRTGVRPETEIFNHGILDNATGPYKALILSAGQPALFTLVAGVDQYRRTANGELVEGSLIPTPYRVRIFQLISENKPASTREAVALTTQHLAPVVKKIQDSFNEPVISLLAPGPMLAILPEVAMLLGIHGIRVGLEDALNVPDEQVAGGIRRCTTADQVKFVCERIARLGGRIMTTSEARERLKMCV